MKTKIFAHRGASAYAHENSLEAFELAVFQNADGVELDVQLTKDNIPVVIHDEMINNFCDKTGFVKDYTLKELRQCNFNKINSVKNSKIASLKEVYELLKPTNVNINVEFKTSIFPYDGIVDLCLELEKEFNLDDRIVYSSFNHRTLINLLKKNKNADAGLLFSDGWVDCISYAIRLGLKGINPAFFLLKDSFLIEKAKLNNLKIHTWTLDEEEDIRFAIEKEVDTIITNKPDKAIKIRNTYLE